MFFDRKRPILLAILVVSVTTLTTALSQNETFCAESQQIQLIIRPAEGTCYKVRTIMRASGHLLLQSPDNSKETRVPLQVHGTLGYHERMLGDTPLRSARHYHESHATITAGGRSQEMTMPENQRWIGCRFVDGLISIASLDQPLSESERDLIDLQGNSLLLAQLIPDKVRRNQKWLIEDALAGALVGIDATLNSTVTATLTHADSRSATIDLVGYVIGGVNGIQTKIQLKGQIKVDIASRSIMSFELNLEERREIGDGQPGLDIAAHLFLKMEPADIPNELTADKIAVLMDPDSQNGQPLRFESDELGISLLYTPQWRVVLKRFDVAVLRQLDSGEMISNMTINSLTSAPPNKQLAMASFRSEIERALAESGGKMLEASEEQNEEGVRVMRVTAAGAVENVSLYWVYYHISDKDGRRASAIVTVDSDKVPRYAEAERSLIASWKFIPRLDRPETARKE